MKLLLAATGITKRYQPAGNPAVDDANLTVDAGTIHGVVGENGAGKSTFMHVLAGLETADAGKIELSGKEVRFLSSADAIAAGVVISFQHPRMVGSLTVWENLILGDEPVKRFALDRSGAADRIRATGMSIPGLDLDARVRNLSSGRVRLVSILAAIMRLPPDRPGVLILDEPTAACGPDETSAIVQVMKNAAAAGHGVIFITHKLDEMESIADAATVMRLGRTIARKDRPIDSGEIARLVFGEQTHPPSVPADRLLGDVVLEVSDLGLQDNVRLSHISFSVRAGEIFGITGTRQSGIEALEEVLGGVCRPDSGTISFRGHDVTGMSSHGLRRNGIGYVPTDRMVRGASLGSSVADNLIVLERRQLQRAGVFLPTQVSRYGGRIRDKFDIDGVLHMPLSRLSGGNIQKVILGRELAEQPALLIICEPSWGLDARSRNLIVTRIRELAGSGGAVLIMSTDIDEVLEIADTVAGLYDGKLVACGAASGFDRNDLGRLVYGSRGEESDVD